MNPGVLRQGKLLPPTERLASDMGGTGGIFSKIQVSQICWLLQGVPYFSSFVNGNASTQRVFPGAEPTNTLENSQAVLTCARSLQEQLDNQVSGRS